MARKKVIYLFGSGVTHAVINDIDESKRLLTEDIREKIREKEKVIKNIEIPVDVWNELMDPSVDIEHLISLLESNYHYSSAQFIRKYYHDAIINLSKEVIENVNESIHTPNLYSILLDLYNVRKLNEKVICILTLNYEDLFEQTLKSHLEIDTNYLLGKKRGKKKEISVLKLHGSFNWMNTRPIYIKNVQKIKSSEALWIPPGIDKKKENYPFNILWGKAFEFLIECNILRIVGSSLSRNDWGLIQLIYTAKRLSGSNITFEIEIIDFWDVGQKIKDAYPYLNVKSIIDIADFKNYLIDRYTLSSLSIPKYVKDDFSSTTSKRLNIFELWLRAKGFNLLDQSINISTSKNPIKNYFENFIKQKA